MQVYPPMSHPPGYFSHTAHGPELMGPPLPMYQWCPPPAAHQQHCDPEHHNMPAMNIPAAYMTGPMVYGTQYAPVMFSPPNMYLPQVQPSAPAPAPTPQQQQDGSAPWNGRYVPVTLLGSGTYGQVYKCTDLLTGATVAVKVANREAAYRRSALAESNVLGLLRECDNVAVILETFEDGGHVCIATEMLDMNLLELMKSRGGKPLPLKHLAHVASNILNTLAVMHSCGYIHCDVKPENVMLRDRRKGCSSACLIDYGAVRRLDENSYHDIQSLWYRAPEVMCTGAYTPKIDVWSVGCLLFELATGAPLFAGSDVKDQLMKVVACLGSPNKGLCQCANFCGMGPIEYHPGVRDLSKILVDERVKAIHNDESSTTITLFLDLLYRVLACDPDVRLSAADALCHPFLQLGAGSPAPRTQYVCTPLSSNDSTPNHLLTRSRDSYAPQMGVSGSSMEPVPMVGSLTVAPQIMVPVGFSPAFAPPSLTPIDMATSPLQSVSFNYTNGWNGSYSSPQMIGSFGVAITPQSPFEVFV